MAIIGFSTEYLDFMKALYKALPKQYRPGYYELHYRDKVTGELKTYWKKRWHPSLAQEHQAIWEHYEHIDMEKAFEYLVENQVEDVAYGTIGRASGAAGRANGWVGGVQLGPWDTAAGGSGEVKLDNPFDFNFAG